MQKHKIQLNGIDLKIDPAINETCKGVSQSASNSRTVLYALLFMTLLSFIALWNSRDESWLESRLKYMQESNAALYDSIIDTTQLYQTQICLIETKGKDSLRIACFNEEWKKMVAKQLERYNANLRIIDQLIDVRMEGSMRIHIPGFGVSTDINDLGLTAGLAFSILMVILLFTLDSEFTNVKVVFRAITFRYSDNTEVDDEDFKKAFEKWTAHLPEEAKAEYNHHNFIRAVNHSRRKHHYQYLSMSTIYTLPQVLPKERPSALWRTTTYMVFALPFLVMLMIFFYDHSTVSLGFPISLERTVDALVFDAFFTATIGFLTFLIARKQWKHAKLWDNFYNNDCRLPDDEILN